jgi:hypothetical protein
MVVEQPPQLRQLDHQIGSAADMGMGGFHLHFRVGWIHVHGNRAHDAVGDSVDRAERVGMFLLVEKRG